MPRSATSPLENPTRPAILARSTLIVPDSLERPPSDSLESGAPAPCTDTSTLADDWFNSEVPNDTSAYTQVRWHRSRTWLGAAAVASILTLGIIGILSSTSTPGHDYDVATSRAVTPAGQPPARVVTQPRTHTTPVAAQTTPQTTRVAAPTTQTTRVVTQPKTVPRRDDPIVVPLPKTDPQPIVTPLPAARARR